MLYNFNHSLLSQVAIQQMVCSAINDSWGGDHCVFHLLSLVERCTFKEGF